MSWHVRRSIVNQLMNILVGHLDVTVTLKQLAILASAREADLARDSLNVSDTADLRNLPRSTVSSNVARLSNTTANGMGFSSRLNASRGTDAEGSSVNPGIQKIRLKALLENTGLTHSVRKSYEKIFQHLADCR